MNNNVEPKVMLYHVSEDRRRIVVHGFVQGVGYRAFVKALAHRMGVRGKVKNPPDGRSVEIIAVGPGETLDLFTKSLEVKAEGPLTPT